MKRFFKYGGGVTLSGGEPLFQHEFALAILKACKQKNLHTAIETSLFVKRENFSQNIAIC